MPGILDFLNPAKQAFGVNTPGINPAAPPIPTGAPPSPSSLQKFLSNPMLLNVLAQQGHSLTPGPSPLGVVGRAGLATNQQNQANERADITNQLLRSKIGLTQAQTQAASSVQPESAKAVTDLGKLAQDLGNGIISPDDYKAKRTEILSANSQRGFDNEKVLRDEFSKRTKGVTDSLQAVSQAEALLATSENPVAEMAAFISLIKSIDNSTVREGELNNFSKVSGIVSQLESLAGRAAGKGAFEPGVREDIQSSLGALRGNLEKMHGGFRDFYGSEAERHGLNRRGVVGGPIPESNAPAAPIADSGPQETAQPPTQEAPPLTEAARQFGVTEAEWALMPQADRDLFN